jgi:toxin-antitoxin system PIN domain toxin
LILTDVNALVYAFRPQTSFHQLARDAITAFRDRGDLIVLTDIATSFIRIVTDKRLNLEADEPGAAITFIDALTADTRFLREPRISRWRTYRELNERVDVRGSLVPDALLAATSLDFGAAVLTADRDFLRFPGVRVHLMTSIGIIDHTVT